MNLKIFLVIDCEAHIDMVVLESLIVEITI